MWKLQPKWSCRKTRVCWQNVRSRGWETLDRRSHSPCDTIFCRTGLLAALPQIAQCDAGPRAAVRQTKPLFSQRRQSLWSRAFAQEELDQNPSTYLKCQTHARRWSIRAGLRTSQSCRVTDIETWNSDSVEQTADVFERWSYPVVLGIV